MAELIYLVNLLPTVYFFFVLEVKRNFEICYGFLEGDAVPIKRELLFLKVKVKLLLVTYV